ncbi:MAG: hypothetical protein LC623_09720, partial [Halobacteriales archaeon]|nr:hypothetical protein [Halobacteriales archaeon]
MVPAVAALALVAGFVLGLMPATAQAPSDPPTLPDPTVPVSAELTQHFSMVTIPAAGTQPVVNIPAPESLRFDLVVRLPYLGGAADMGVNPSALLHTVNELGIPSDALAQINVHGDTSDATVGDVTLYFPQ